ncbi:MAG: hypothetical protein LBU17_10635 [Treponema sp.]|jgi:hypothetical protein|nr:hypothetical protein [Treponema sp.]
MARNFVTQLYGYDFDNAKLFADMLIAELGDKKTISFDKVTFKYMQTKKGVKLEGSFFTMQLLFVYSPEGAYILTEEVSRPIAIFYDAINIVGGYLGNMVIPEVEFLLNDTDIAAYIDSLVKSTDNRFAELSAMVRCFQWPEPTYKSRSANLFIKWYSRKTENQSACKLFAQFQEEYDVSNIVLLEATKCYDRFLLLFCGTDVFYSAHELEEIDLLLEDVSRITYKFIIKIERDDEDKARLVDIPSFRKT